MINLPKYTTYLLNLDRAEDRLALMQKEFDKQNLAFERVSAVDAQTLKEDSYIIKSRYPKPMSKGEVACYLSHVNMLKQFLASDNEFVLIIEDDAVLLEGFKEKVEKALVSYKDLPKKHQWDILKLHNGRRKYIKIMDIDTKHLIGACGLSLPTLAIATIWTRKGTEKFLSKVEKPLVIRRPIDCDIQHPWEFDNLRVYNLIPSLVDIAPVESQMKRIEKNSNKVFKQIAYEVNRFFLKFYYIISHHGFKSFFNSFVLNKK